MPDNMNMSRPGIVNLTSDGSWAQDNQLFKDVFLGEVLTAFEETNIARELQMVRTITSGKSASFPATWKFDAGYHVPGTPILGDNAMPHNEVIIKIDDLLKSSVFVNELDELKNFYDVRSIYSTELGRALAREFDKKSFRVGVKAARSSGVVAGAPGGSVLKDTTCATDSDKLAEMLFLAAQTLDEKDVPTEDRNCVLRPAQYYLLAQNTKVLNKDWDGKGSYSDGKVVKIADITLMKSNNLPATNIAAGVAGENNDYTGDFTNTVGLVLNKWAMGTVQLMALRFEMSGNDIAVMYQGTLMLAKMAVGHGVIRPECAIELSKAAA